MSVLVINLSAFRKNIFSCIGGIFISLQFTLPVRSEPDWLNLWSAPPKCYKIEESVRTVNLRTEPWKLSPIEKKRVGLYMTSLPVGTEQFPEELYFLDLGKANSVITVIFPRLNCETYCKGATIIGDGSAMKQYDFLYRKYYTLFKFRNSILDTKAMRFTSKDGSGVMVLYFLNKDYFKNDHFLSVQPKNSKGMYFGIVQSGMLAQENGEGYIQDDRNMKLLIDTGTLIELQKSVRIRADSSITCALTRTY